MGSPAGAGYASSEWHGGNGGAGGPSTFQPFPTYQPRPPRTELEDHERWWFSPGRCADAYHFHGIKGIEGLLAKGWTVPEHLRPQYETEARAAFRTYLHSIRDHRMKIRTALRRELEWKGLLSYSAATVLIAWGIPSVLYVTALLWKAALGAWAG